MPSKDGKFRSWEQPVVFPFINAWINFVNFFFINVVILLGKNKLSKDSKWRFWGHTKHLSGSVWSQKQICVVHRLNGTAKPTTHIHASSDFDKSCVYQMSMHPGHHPHTITFHPIRLSQLFWGIYECTYKCILLRVQEINPMRIPVHGARLRLESVNFTTANQHLSWNLSLSEQRMHGCKQKPCAQCSLIK